VAQDFDARQGIIAGGRPMRLEVVVVLRSFVLAVFAIGSLLSGNLAAQEWAEKMFKTLEHDFGTVARGADTVYKFEVKNLYKQEMHITGVRSSCGCTSPSVEHGDLKTHEKGYIVARFNTRTHVGQRSATLTVTFGAPYAAEVQLHVHGNIRGDVVFNPGAVEFGDVTDSAALDADAGSTASRERIVSVDYAGRDDWQITDVTNDNDNFEVELKEAQRSAGRVSYKLLVRLKPGVPVGYVKDQLTVVTNDSRAENQRIPLIVSGRVKPEFSVTPEQLVLGELETGKQLTKKIIVRADKPFKIVNVTCGEDCFDFKTAKEARAVHFVDVTFRAGEAPGKLQTPIHIVTDRNPTRGPVCLASATVVAPKPPAPDVDAPQAEPAAAGNGLGDAAVRTASAP